MELIIQKEFKTVRASLRNVMISPRKLGLICGLMRKMKTVSKCVAQLMFHPRQKPCKIMLKLLNSAIANAKQAQYPINDLTINTIYVGRGGANIKRTYFRGRGKVDQKEKYSSNVEIILNVCLNNNTMNNNDESINDQTISKDEMVEESQLNSEKMEDKKNG
jgi:ribosomal protein L22